MWIKRKDYEDLVQKVADLNKQLRVLAARPQLVDVYDDGMKMVFVVHVGGVDYTIETVPVIEGGIN